MEVKLSKKFKIGEIEHITGLSAKIIRRYEETGMLSKSNRNTSGYRVYNENDLLFFKILAKMKSVNLSEKTIKLFLRENRDSNFQGIETGGEVYLNILKELESKSDALGAIKKIIKG